MQAKSEKFGRVLKLPKATVKDICQQHSDPKDRLFAVVDEFVDQVEPPPTWRVILEALRHPLIGLPQLAQEIEGKHCPFSPQNEGIYLPYQMPLSSTTINHILLRNLRIIHSYKAMKALKCKTLGAYCILYCGKFSVLKRGVQTVYIYTLNALFASYIIIICIEYRTCHFVSLP